MESIQNLNQLGLGKLIKQEKGKTSQRLSLLRVWAEYGLGRCYGYGSSTIRFITLPHGCYNH